MKIIYFGALLATLSLTCPIYANQHCHTRSYIDKKTHEVVSIKRCKQGPQHKNTSINMHKSKTQDESALAIKLDQEIALAKISSGLGYYEPTYIIPAYYSSSISPYYAHHKGSTPEGQPIQHLEFKGQMSFAFPLWLHMFGSPFSLGGSYTQLMYWQLYAKSPFFRETNYEPRLFISYHPKQNLLFSLGVDHQSNGRGGTGPNGMERSWNRVFLDMMFSGRNWIVIIEPWVPILKAWSSDLHNKDITHYMGYGRMIFAYKFHSQEISLMLRNQLESGFQRGAIEADYSFPLYNKLHGFVQVFSGYGQSLIEYNHYTNSVGLGIALSNWI